MCVDRGSYDDSIETLVFEEATCVSACLSPGVAARIPLQLNGVRITEVRKFRVVRLRQDAQQVRPPVAQTDDADPYGRPALGLCPAVEQWHHIPRRPRTCGTVCRRILTSSQSDQFDP